MLDAPAQKRRSAGIVGTRFWRGIQAGSSPGKGGGAYRQCLGLKLYDNPPYVSSKLLHKANVDFMCSIGA